MLGRGLDIDVIHPDAGPADHLQEWRRLEHVRRDLGLGPHGNGMHIPDEFQHLFGRGSVSLDDFEARLLAQVGDSFG